MSLHDVYAAQNTIDEAIEKRDVATVSKMITSGTVSINRLSRPQLLARLRSHVEILALVVQHGHLRIGNMMGGNGFFHISFMYARSSALSVICRHAQGPALADLVRALTDESLFDRALELRCRTTLRVFVTEMGANIDHCGDYQSTALQRAASIFRDHFSERDALWTEDLIALGADVYAVSADNRETVYALAVSRKNSSVLCACLAAGVDLDQPDNEGVTLRMFAMERGCPLPTATQIEAARRRIAKAQLEFVRYRATEICIGMQPLRLDALQLCEILMRWFGARRLGRFIKFHQWWAIATTVKHFRTASDNQEGNQEGTSAAT